MAQPDFRALSWMRTNPVWDDTAASNAISWIADWKLPFHGFKDDTEPSDSKSSSHPPAFLVWIAFTHPLHTAVVCQSVYGFRNSSKQGKYFVVFQNPLE